MSNRRKAQKGRRQTELQQRWEAIHPADVSPPGDTRQEERPLQADPIVAVRRARAATQSADRKLTHAVDAARSAGSSWAEIGAGVGMTAEGARRRWGPSRAQ